MKPLMPSPAQIFGRIHSFEERLKAPFPPLPGRAESSEITEEVPGSFADFLDQGLNALLQRDYPLAWIAYAAADEINPGDPIVLANLTRIRQLGFAPEPVQA